MKCRVLGLSVALVVTFLGGALGSVPVEWITRYGSVHPEGLNVVMLNGYPWRNLTTPRFVSYPEELDGATYLQRRTYWYDPDDLWLQGIGELNVDWLGNNRVSVSEACAIVLALRDTTDAQRAGLVGEGWHDFNDTMGISRYGGPPEGEPYSIFYQFIAAGVVDVPTQVIPEHSLPGSGQEMVFMFVESERMPAVPEPSTLTLWLVFGALAAGIGWWRKRRPV